LSEPQKTAALSVNWTTWIEVAGLPDPKYVDAETFDTQDLKDARALADAYISLKGKDSP
jgi:hypothetical protein